MQLRTKNFIQRSKDARECDTGSNNQLNDEKLFAVFPKELHCFCINSMASL